MQILANSCKDWKTHLNNLQTNYLGIRNVNLNYMLQLQYVMLIKKTLIDQDPYFADVKAEAKKLLKMFLNRWLLTLLDILQFFSFLTSISVL